MKSGPSYEEVPEIKINLAEPEHLAVTPQPSVEIPSSLAGGQKTKTCINPENALQTECLENSPTSGPLQLPASADTAAAAVDATFPPNLASPSEEQTSAPSSSSLATLASPENDQDKKLAAGSELAASYDAPSAELAPRDLDCDTELSCDTPPQPSSAPALSSQLHDNTGTNSDCSRN